MIRTIKTIGTIGAMTILICGAYLLGTTQVGTVTVTAEVIKEVETVPSGYIKLSECIPLDDIACYFIDDYDYPCFKLKDVERQLNNASNRSYADIMQGMENQTEDFKNNYIDMRLVTDFITNGGNLQLYFEDGSGYHWER